MLSKMADLVRALRGPTLRERELAYLNEAHDRFDLEWRERQIDRGLFRKQQVQMMLAPGLR